MPRRHKRTVSKGTFFVSLAIAVAVSFVAGTRSAEIYATIAPVFGIKASSDTLDLALVQKTYQELKANYDGELDSAALVDGAARGMVAAAGDRYTVFMDKKEAQDFQKQLSGEVTGIGCELGVRADQPTAIRVLTDSPAEKAGLMASDVFTAVNGESVVGADASTVASKIRGQEGTSVKVTVKRGSETKEFTIVRAKITDPSVRWSEANGIGTLTISRFDTDTGKLARQAAESFAAHHVTGVIVDLRDNGGGYVTAAQDVSGLWLNNKILMTTKDNRGKSENVYSQGTPVLAGIKTVILVNGGSASASEIVSGALQEYGAATLIGEKTFGKGTEQQVIDLPDGRKLKVTIARWYTPKGRNITKEGITPDKTVPLTTTDANASRDPQLDAARELIVAR